MKVNLYESQSETPIQLVVPDEGLVHVSVIQYREKYFLFKGFDWNPTVLEFHEINPPIDFSEAQEVSS